MTAARRWKRASPSDPVDEALKGAALKHIGYEVAVLAQLPHQILRLDAEASSARSEVVAHGRRVAATGALEAFLLHTRNVCEFAWGDHTARRMHALDFVPGWTPHGSKALSLKRRIGPLNEHLAHLDWKRVVDPPRPWPYLDILAEVVDVMEQFHDALGQWMGLAEVLRPYMDAARDAAAKSPPIVGDTGGG